MQVVAQFADDYVKIEEKLALYEQELEEVKNCSQWFAGVDLFCHIWCLRSRKMTWLQMTPFSIYAEFGKSSKYAVSSLVFFSFLFIIFFQDGTKTDLVGALQHLTESLQEICSASENVTELLVSTGI